MEIAPRSRFERTIAAFLTLGALAVLAALVVRAWRRPLFPWDCWSYHLPFAARLHGISSPESFVFDRRIWQMYEGFPLLAEWLQGALWRLAGSVRGAGLLNAFALVGLVGYLSASFRLPAAALVFGFLAVPMVAIHAASGYVDLFAGVAVALQAAAALRLLELSSDDAPRPPGRFGIHAVVFVAAAAAAGNTKVPSAALAVVAAGFLLVHAARRRFARRRWPLAGLAVLAVAAASLTLARNAIVYSNPFHPLNPAHLERPLATVDPAPPPEAAAPAPGAEPRRDSRWLRDLGLWSRPVAFLLSATEIDWLQRGVEPHFDIDSNTGDRPRRGGPARTGGWWGPYVVALVAIVLLEARARRASGWSGTERRTVALLALTAAAAAATPISYLLRYWIHVPLLLVFAAVLFVARRGGAAASTPLSAALGVVFLVSWLALPSDASLDPRPFHRYDPQTTRARLRPELARAIEAGRSFCLDARHDPLHFRYSAALLGGTHAIEQVRDRRGCRVYPLLDVPAPGLLPPARRESPSAESPTTTRPTSSPSAPARTAS